jgi:Ca2+-binding RTX toxin-like protein
VLSARDTSHSNYWIEIMRISPWLRSLFRRQAVTRHAVSRSAIRQRKPAWEAVQLLEPRALLTGISIFNSGTLTITLPNDEDVRVSRLGANVRVEFGEAGVYQDDAALGTIPATSVSTVIVIGGDGNNDINLSQMTSSTFPSLSTVDITGDDGNDNIRTATSVASMIDAGDGTDTVIGSSGADTINAGNGADSVDGQAGNDSIDGGDGNDTLLGGTGLDTINGGNGTDSILGGNDSG